MSAASGGERNGIGDGPIPVVEFEAIDSTNLEAMRRATHGERGPLWLRADRQIAGKGRSGRGWSSPAGNLSATLLFAPDCPLDCLAQLSLVFGIALVDAVRNVCETGGRPVPDGLHLKWPNDVLIGPAKLAGILIETSVISGVTIVAVGCGVNIAIAPDVADRPVTCLADHVIAVSPSAFLEVLSAAARDWLRVWSCGRDFGAIRSAWLARANPVGTPISVNTGSGSEAGRFAGLDTDGALLMSDGAGNLRRFHFGDVTGAPSQQGSNGQAEVSE